MLALTALLCGFYVSAEAQQTKKPYRIGYLSNADPGTASARSEPIHRALHELGYVEGQNLVTEYRYAAGKLDRYTALVAELLRLKVDIILVAGGVRTVRAAKSLTKTVPIVMMGAGLDPVKAGLVESLARPGGNVTGVTYLPEELSGKRLELLKEAVPKLAHVAVLYDSAATLPVLELKQTLPMSARMLGLTLEPWEVRSADDFDTVFAAISKQRPDALYVSVGPLTHVNGKRIATFALTRRLPSIYAYKEDVEAAGLMYYGADVSHIDRLVAWYVDKILKGARPADLPVQQATKYELVINLTTANQIGLAIPPNVLARADKVLR